MDSEFGESKDELAEDTDNDIAELMRLPTGKTARRLAKDYFQEIHNSAGLLKEAAFNLQGALRVSANQEKYALEWMEKRNELDAVTRKIAEAYSILMAAAGAGGCRLPVVSNLESVRASNKSDRAAQVEQRPLSVREKRLKRKRDQEAAAQNLDKIQTPLVEAHRPNKKRKSEASRHQKTYLRAAKRSKIPKALHISIQSSESKNDQSERSE